MIVTSGFYWNDSDGTRAFAARFEKLHGMPTREQAGVYASVTHYLKAVKASNTDDAGTVNGTMPVDRFGSEAKILASGRVVYDLGVYRVKTPSQSRFPWDYYERIATIPAAEAFRSTVSSGCSADQNEAKVR
ncbi:hypothetical protein GCM10007857_70010 [Bradyrhizobium iriomotense]|uniref:Leucine-binding protein domain-containing protein n=1 Tax=Bradyrhizobium iriomotense TaxID=441950 RepID=A0ABQ6BDQ6_9BRAD|nr:ABC transporter substrate-binding protein [Bradyrhizobium iriomotense]GLR90287.1 hypothetical protein GCM10007857_70010 [Bradyrhizobium iriomotense]